MTIHVVVGPPCSGKSSYVQMHAVPGTPRFDYDAIASVVAGQDLDHEKPPMVTEAVSIMRRALIGWLMDEEEDPTGDFWFIWSYPGQKAIERLAAAGAKFHLIDPGLDACIERAEKDKRPLGTIDRIKRWYENPPVLPGMEDDEEKEGQPPMHKDFRVDVKAATVTEDQSGGTIEAYAAVFDNVDSYGDIIRKGAFAETLQEWEASGNQIPLLYGHDFADPFANIGVVTSAVEDDHGLKIEAQLDLDNEKAAQVYRLLKERRLSQMSFAFRVLDAAEAEIDGEFVYELTRLKLYEVSVVPIGANEQTEILAVKSAAELISTAVKQAEGLAPTERAALSRACQSAAEELKSSSADDDAGTADLENENRARARAARAFLMLTERSNNA